MPYKTMDISFPHHACGECHLRDTRDDPSASQEYRLHSRYAFQCDECGVPTNHWRKVGDLCMCRACYRFAAELIHSTGSWTLEVFAKTREFGAKRRAQRLEAEYNESFVDLHQALTDADRIHTLVPVGSPQAFSTEQRVHEARDNFLRAFLRHHRIPIEYWPEDL